MCHTGPMSAPSLSEQPALVAADPVLSGHPVVALFGELVERLEALEAELTTRDEEIADLRRQLGRHSGNRGQPPSGSRSAIPDSGAGIRAGAA